MSDEITEDKVMPKPPEATKVLNIRKFPVYLHTRMKMLKQLRSTNANKNETMESLYVEVVKHGITMLEGEIFGDNAKD
jgi:hypothetical protein